MMEPPRHTQSPTARTTSTFSAARILRTHPATPPSTPSSVVKPVPRRTTSSFSSSSPSSSPSSVRNVNSQPSPQGTVVESKRTKDVAVPSPPTPTSAVNLITSTTSVRETTHATADSPSTGAVVAQQGQSASIQVGAGQKRKIPETTAAPTTSKIQTATIRSATLAAQTKTQNPVSKTAKRIRQTPDHVVDQDVDGDGKAKDQEAEQSDDNSLVKVDPHSQIKAEENGDHTEAELNDGVMGAENEEAGKEVVRWSNMENPLIFFCKLCRSIIGDSFAMVTSTSRLDSITLRAVTGVVGDKERLVLSTSPADKGCVYWALFCGYCKTHEIGRVYVSTPKDLLELQNMFTLNRGSLASYTMGTGDQWSAEQVEFPSLQDIQALKGEVFSLQHLSLLHHEKLDALEAKLDELLQLQRPQQQTLQVAKAKAPQPQPRAASSNAQTRAAGAVPRRG